VGCHTPICTYHSQRIESGDILTKDMDNWGKSYDFNIVFPISFYETFALSQCWILVDHATIGGKYTFLMFLQSVDGTWILPFAVKVRKSKSHSFTFDNLVKMAIDLGFNPVGFVGDIEFCSIFNASLYSNSFMVYDMHHILRRLVTDFPTTFPSLTNSKIFEGRTHLQNRKCVGLLQNLQNVGTEEADVIKFILPLFNIGTFTFDREEVINLIKKFRKVPCVTAWVNNLIVYQNLTLRFPSTYAVEKIIHEGHFESLQDTLLKLNTLNNV